MTDRKSIEPVPQRYCGVWRRTLLKTPDVHDADTTVFWLQAMRWHADIRIPARRPDFSGVRTLADCNRAQLLWLAQQQGFAGLTQIDATSQPEICRWHRMVDYRPPSATPDAGFMRFEPTQLVETGVHADYLEHWSRLPSSDQGIAVLQRADDQLRQQFLMVAGNHVMHVRERAWSWPPDLPADSDMTQFDDATLRDALDFEISFGTRTAGGWTVKHSTLPWLEGHPIRITMTPVGNDAVDLAWNGISTAWQVLEWQPPC